MKKICLAFRYFCRPSSRPTVSRSDVTLLPASAGDRQRAARFDFRPLFIKIWGQNFLIPRPVGKVPEDIMQSPEMGKGAGV